MKILIAGDYCPINRLADRFQAMEYHTVLSEIRPVIANVDYAIVNLECPVCYGNEKKIFKRGPNLKCSEKGVEALKWVGFNCVTLANNHFLDYGEEGVKNTIKACDKYKIDYVGGGLNLKEASKIIYKTINGAILAIINCCEHEFSIATTNSAGSNPLNPIKQFYSIQEARDNADYVLLIVHGGHEMFQYPSQRMQQTYRFFVDSGADAVINHHQHCFSGYEIYKGKPIFYGIGNFCFDEPRIDNPIWNEGMMVILEFKEEEVVATNIPYIQCRNRADIRLIYDLEKNSFETRLNIINDVICNEEALLKKVEKFYETGKKRCATTFSPIINRYFNGLQARGYLPGLISRKKMLMLYNNLLCESHRDKIYYYLTSEYSYEKIQ